jgi:hypothetical protein
MNMHSYRPFLRPWVILSVLMSLGLVLTLVSCGSSSTEPPPSTGGGVTSTVTTSMSDPPICEPPAGQFSHIWVTVTQVRAHMSARRKAMERAG